MREISTDDVVWIREFAPGFIGGEEIARNASEKEIEVLIDLGNLIAEADAQLSELIQMREHILRAIKERG